MTTFRWVLLAAALAGGYWWLSPSYGNREPGPSGDYQFAGYQINSLAPFKITGRVLATETYRFDREAELAPLDVALGWGAMADPARIGQLQISQRNRWYYWKTAQLPLPRRELESSMANIHIVPANQAIESQVLALEPGTLVELQGELIEAVGDDGWRWRSSLTRTDTGDGSCELLLLRSLRILEHHP